jgi:hypothetical protein
MYKRGSVMFLEPGDIERHRPSRGSASKIIYFLACSADGTRTIHLMRGRDLTLSKEMAKQLAAALVRPVKALVVNRP